MSIGSGSPLKRISMSVRFVGRLARGHLDVRAPDRADAAVVAAFLRPVDPAARRVERHADAPAAVVHPIGRGGAGGHQRLDAGAVDVRAHDAHAFAVRPVHLAAGRIDAHLLGRVRSARGDQRDDVRAVEVRTASRTRRRRRDCPCRSRRCSPAARSTAMPSGPWPAEATSVCGVGFSAAAVITLPGDVEIEDRRRAGRSARAGRARAAAAVPPRPPVAPPRPSRRARRAATAVPPPAAAAAAAGGAAASARGAAAAARGAGARARRAAAGARGLPPVPAASPPAPGLPAAPAAPLVPASPGVAARPRAAGPAGSRRRGRAAGARGAAARGTAAADRRADRFRKRERPRGWPVGSGSSSTPPFRAVSVASRPRSIARRSARAPVTVPLETFTN